MTRQLELDLDLPQEPSRPSTKTAERRWLEWAAAEWGAFHRRAMTVRWARDLVLTRPLLRQHGEEELQKRWRTYMRTPDVYFARRGWDIPTFSASIDRFAGEMDCAEVVRQWSRRRELQEADERDPLTGVALRYLRRR